MVTSDFRPEVEIWPFRACAMHPVINIATVRLLWSVDEAMGQLPHSTKHISSIINYQAVIFSDTCLG